MRFRGNPNCDHNGAGDSAQVPQGTDVESIGRKPGALPLPVQAAAGEGTDASRAAALKRARGVEVGPAEIEYALDVFREFEELVAVEQGAFARALAELLEDAGLTRDGQALFAEAVDAAAGNDAGIHRGAVFGIFVGLLARQVGEEAAWLFEHMGTGLGTSPESPPDDQP